MGALSLERADRLLWLGRYVERAFTTQGFILATYDKAIDSEPGSESGSGSGSAEGWKGQLAQLGFNDSADDPVEFFDDCLFNADNPSSVARSVSAAYDNAVHLRDVLGSETVSYVQMAYDSVEAARHSPEPLLDLQEMADNVMAFKGCVDDYVTDDSARNVIKSGFSVERIDLYARLGYHLGDLRGETRRLATRLNRMGVPYDQHELKAVVDAAYAPGFPESATFESRAELLGHLARIF